MHLYIPNFAGYAVLEFNKDIVAGNEQSLDLVFKKSLIEFDKIGGRFSKKNRPRARAKPLHSSTVQLFVLKYT